MSFSTSTLADGERVCLFARGCNLSLKIKCIRGWGGGRSLGKDRILGICPFWVNGWKGSFVVVCLVLNRLWNENEKFRGSAFKYVKLSVFLGD